MPEIRRLGTDAELRAAAHLAGAQHAALRARRPFLPGRDAAHFLPKIAWIAERGPVLGLFERSGLTAFLGGFRLDDYRNEGPATLVPDWCHAVAPGVDACAAVRALYREIAPRWVALAGRIQAICVYDGADGIIEGLALTGFGRFVAEAARPSDALVDALADAPMPEGGAVRRAGPEDAEALAALSAQLAAHIAAPPVFMPNTHGTSADAFRAFFGDPKAVAWIAERDGTPVGFVRAQAPQIDVSDAVHAPDTLAIDRLFVTPSARNRGMGKRLVAELARFALASGDALVSVDYETLNLEAHAFWMRWFFPVGWSLERRLPAAPAGS